MSAVSIMVGAELSIWQGPFDPVVAPPIFLLFAVDGGATNLPDVEVEIKEHEEDEDDFDSDEFE
ncbi:hypothetical protein E2562_028837 [Oryza meyeriana var. granulata]|uniref:Uncharacterized protein n=1 Tax=Oryza meyeriana var. granulata TaxID=110450 RepID=A0A6G1FDF7_9ORYZ|nr:hypothetical protein E2562_028837 [Oryza meyeriana var. granulata]